MRISLILTIAVLAALLAVPAGAQDTGSADDPADDPADDVVVIAVVDSGFSAYHADLDARFMPQHMDADASNDLPLDTAPDQWLPGFPSPDTFGSYEEISLTRGDGGTPTAELRAQDAEEWDRFARTTTDGDDVNYRWLSGSKIIGAVDFSGNWSGANNNLHGAKVSSVTAGNIHGTCPECVVVLVTYDSSSTASYERASDWAMRQPWIDVVTNSYGYSTVLLEKVYFGASLDVSRAAVERGQQVFYSAGNGQANAFTAPQSTYYSSQKSPDWITTVGAVEPDTGQAFMGAGKGVDIASVGIRYPSMGGSTEFGTGTFSGTSNATPVSAGIYAKSLLLAREALGGPSRTQADGVVATGTPVDCGDANTECELGDGVLTRDELEDRFFAAPTRTNAGLTISQFANPVGGVTTDEIELLSTGHGVFFGTMANPITGETRSVDAEVDRIVGPLLGDTEGPTVTPETRDFMIVDSFCKQQAWGAWDSGLYVGDNLPGPDPLFPTRTALEAGCPALTVFGNFTDAQTPASPIQVSPEEG